jgi:glycerate kinase
MVQRMPVLVAPDAFSSTLRAPVVAAAIGRGLERAGAGLPDLCPVAGGGRGTIEVLLPVLGGETGDGFALIEDGGTALVELGATPQETGRRIVAAASAGVQVVLLCADELAGGAGIAAEIDDRGGLRDAAVVVLCTTPGVAGGELATELRARYEAVLVPGPAFVLEQLGFDARMRAARAVVVGEARLDRATLEGRVTGEIAYRARQAGVPCHAATACTAIGRFDARILDVQAIVAATTIAELETAGERLAAAL